MKILIPILLALFLSSNANAGRISDVCNLAEQVVTGVHQKILEIKPGDIETFNKATKKLTTWSQIYKNLSCCGHLEKTLALCG